MSNIKRILLAVFIFLIPFSAEAQVRTGTISLKANVAAPKWEFLLGTPAIGMKPATGFGLQIEYAHPLGMSRLSWVTTTGFQFNSTNPPSIHMPNETQIVGKSLGNWLNIPIMTGIRYLFMKVSSVQFYGQGQLGFNISKPPDGEISYLQNVDGQTLERFVKEEYDGLGHSYFLSIGAGAILYDRFMIEFSYLGDAQNSALKANFNPKFTLRDEERTSEIIREFEASIQFFVFSVGIIIK